MKFKVIDYFLTFMKAVILLVLAAPTLFMIFCFFQSRAMDLQNINDD